MLTAKKLLKWGEYIFQRNTIRDVVGVCKDYSLGESEVTRLFSSELINKAIATMFKKMVLKTSFKTYS